MSAEPSPAFVAYVDGLVRPLVAEARAAGRAPAELRAALQAVVAGIVAGVAQTVPRGDPGVHMAEAWLVRRVEQELQAYAAAPAKPKGIGGIFANAVETNKQTPWANAKGETSVTLTCPACGAAQERTLDFTCRYCHASFAKKEER
jgi:hypothetical protein